MRGLGGGDAGGTAAGRPGKQDGEEEVVGAAGGAAAEKPGKQDVRRRGEAGGAARGRSSREKGGKRYRAEVAQMAERGATCLQKQGQRLLPVTALRLP
ncbi:hypothetical protein NDU88_001049 [Pleurodeles waltl]|uniref:Uncharacterized protein n=1 Tax=Pleurodeles waltl TaxID=8319 RepID=A0AAV7V8M6_PLEWA|nr:hypothetical protein NDU88_001049 [Pleurodeles waltl]